MRKFRAIVAFFMVILIQITPWPLGLRPVHAALPILVPVAVGALVLAAGAAGSGTPALYSQAIYDASKTAVDSVTGNVTRGLIAATALGIAGSQVMYGANQQISLAFDTVADWVRSHAADFPLLSGPINACFTPPPVIGQPIGFVYHSVYQGTANTYLSPSANMNQTLGNFRIIGEWQFVNQCGPHPQSLLDTPFIYGTLNVIVTATHYCGSGYPQKRWYVSIQSTTDPVTPVAETKNPAAFAPSISHSPETQAEIDKLIFGAPPVTWNPSLPKQISPFSPAQAPPKIETSIPWPQSVPLPIPGTAIPEIPPLAYPGEPTISIPATIIPGVDGAPPIIITGTGEEALPDLYKPQESISDYNPSALDGPYTLPAVNFAQRFTAFVTATKNSSIFSLPLSVFDTDIFPTSDISTITIDGGDLFGTHIFDLADMSNMWVVLRSIVFVCFSFVAVRIVALKQ